jgi:imidazolonepropionase-like amidohydrolase
MMTRGSLPIAFLTGLGLFSANCGSSDSGPFGANPDAGVCESCIAFVGGVLFDGSEARAGTLVIDGERILELLPPEARPAVGTTIDVAGKTVLPGLIDLHAHLRDPAGPWGFATPSFPFVEEHLKSLLRAGVTTVLDVGSDRDFIFELRARVRSGALLSPDLLAVGSMITVTGGHPCYAGTPPGRTCIAIDSPAEVSRLSQLLLPREPDAFKIVISPPSLPSLSFDSMTAISAVGKANALPVFAHVATPENAVDAANAGVRALAHVPMYGTFTPDQVALIAARRVAVIPTLAVNENLWELAKGTTRYDDPMLSDDVPEEVLDALREKAKSPDSAQKQASTDQRRQTAIENLKLLISAGVEVAAGTDCGIAGTIHGPALRQELGLYVSLGLSPIEALKTATSTAASVLSLSDRGQLVPGALADLMIVDGDATLDLARLERVSRVYRRGRPIDPGTLALSQGTSLEQIPGTPGASGAACVFQRECEQGLVCNLHDVRCTPSCVFPNSIGCPTGATCITTGGSTPIDYCRIGDDCALLAQDCENGSACLFAGNAATFCMPAVSSATHGQACDLGRCAPGSQCEPSSLTCRALCDPMAPTCPAGSSCLDASGFAGLAIGYCA